MALTNKLSAIGDAIRAKTGGTELLTLDEMPVAINSITTGGGSAGEDGDFYDRLIERTLTEIKEGDIPTYTTRLGQGAFEYIQSLQSAYLPDHITYIDTYAFTSCNDLHTVRLPDNSSLQIAGTAFDNLPNLTTMIAHEHIPSVNQGFISNNGIVKIYVPGKVLDNYYAADVWGNTYVRTFLTASTPYIGTVANFKVAGNAPKTVTLPLMGLDTGKYYEFAVTVSSGVDVDITDSIIDVYAGTLTFTVGYRSQDGDGELLVSLAEDYNSVFERHLSFTAVPELVTGSYTVENVDGAEYGFTLADDGFYESANTNVDDSFAYCKVVINNPTNLPCYFDYYQNTENGYDYGMLSVANGDIPMHSDDIEYHEAVLQSFKNIDASLMQTYLIEGDTHECYFTIRYRKDGSGNNGDDKFRFRFRME